METGSPGEDMDLIIRNYEGRVKILLSTHEEVLWEGAEVTSITGVEISFFPP